jgi:hypothetical protein
VWHENVFKAMTKFLAFGQRTSGSFCTVERLLSTSHFQRHHQKIIFPVALVYPVSEVSEEWHSHIVAVKVINLNLRAE